MSGMSTKHQVHANHRARLRSRYEQSGLDSFEPHVILELLLFETIPRVDTNPIGHRLIQRFGSLDRVFSASEEELCEVKGVGPKTAAMLKRVSEHMLFRMLDGCDLSRINDRLYLAAEYHMRNLTTGDVTLFTPFLVFDYTSDGGTDGLCEAIRSDLCEHGTEEYAVIVKAGADGISDELKREIEKGKFSSVFMLTESELMELK